MVEPLEWKTGAFGVTPTGGAPVQPRIHRPDPEEDGPTFPEMLKRGLEEVNRLQSDSATKISDLVTGQTDNYHQVMIAVEEAGIAFQLTMQVRNQILKAYDELMRMPI
ncbi:MAG: flagellar hook-basal body complex protein FliE [bacterium]